jgi:hypothetical protein
MLKRNLEDLGVNQLKRFEKTGLILLGILMSTIVLNVFIMSVLFIIGKSEFEKFSILIPGLTCIVIVISMYIAKSITNLKSKRIR